MIDLKKWFSGEPFESKLGMKFVVLVLATGLIPVVLIAFPLYFTTVQTMKERGREQVKNYLRLTSGRLFQTLRTAENEIVRLANSGKVGYHPESSMFARVEVIKRSRAALNSAKMPWEDFSPALFKKLEKGDVVLSPPYDNGRATVVSVLTAYGDDKVIIGELKPTELWQAGRASYIGGSNMFVVVNNNGKILNSSNHDYFEPLDQIDKNIFSSEQTEFVSGQTELGDRGSFFWGKKTLYLKARFGSGIWYVYLFHPLSEVYSLPTQLVQTITAFLAIALLIFILLALRFSRRLLVPIKYLINASKHLTAGEYGRTVSVDTGDELETLADAFNEMSEALAKTIRRKDTLLSEIHHRVKNNLQVIISLLRLQRHQGGTDQESKVLAESEERIRSMALVHEKLYRSGNMPRGSYRSGNMTQIKAEDYVKDLVKKMQANYGGESGEVNFKYGIDGELALAIDHSIPCGLIVHELVANALEHAFDGSEDSPLITIKFNRSDGKYRLSVEDNGRGIKEDFDPQVDGSFGFEIVHSLACDQLNGEIFYSAEGGTKVMIEFPAED